MPTKTSHKTKLKESSMSLVQLKTKAQVTLPVKLRKALNLQIGDYFKVGFKDNIIFLKPVKTIDRDEAWFWTKEWQAGERKIDEDIKAGRYEIYDTPEEFFKSLRDIRKNKGRNKK